MNRYMKGYGLILFIVIWFFGSQYMAMYLMMMLKGGTYVQDHSFFVTFISYILCLLPYMLWNRQQNMSRAESAYKKIGVIDVFKYMGYGVGLWILTSMLNALLLPFFPTYSQEIDTLFVTNEPVLRFVVLVIGAPIVEEYLFRGKIQNTMEDLFGKSLSIVGQGVLFGLIHPFGLQKVYASVLGIGLGYVKHQTKNLVAPTVMHMTINGIAWVIATFIG